MSDAFLPPKRTVGPYRVAGVLGRGGMGVVYEAVAPDGAEVAIKVVRDPSESGLMRFEREARIRIDHPNVVRLLDTGRDEDGSPYIVFELLRGESLKAQMRRARPSVAQVIELGVELCRGLAAAHAAGIIHRDLKPGNIHRCEDGTYKILDFGLALRDGAETQLVTVDRAGMGTPTYLSPEQVRGDRDVDRRTDLWSLGVVLYEALAGRKPFERDVALGTMLAIVLEEPDPLRTRRPDVSPELAEIVDRCLAKNRERRWSSADEIERALVALPAQSDDVRTDASIVLPGTSRGASARTSDVTELRTELASAPSIPAGEQRVVAIVLAEGVADVERFSAAVSRRGGLVISFIGQCAIGVFGAERWEGDEITRAAGAALEARSAVGAISIASGRAARSGHGIAGAVVRAAEAGCLAGLAGVAVDVATARSLDRRFVLREAYEGYAEILVQTADRASSHPRAGDRGGTLGRELELARITRAVDAASADGGARAVLLVGPLGIGKSAVLRDAVAQIEATADERVVLSGRAEPHLRESSHALVSALLHARARAGATSRGWSRLDPEVPIEVRQKVVLELASDAIDDWRRANECAELLGELLGVPMPESTGLSAARADVLLMNDRIAVALSDWLGGLASRGPLALVLEDLQWADAASLDVIEELLAVRRDLPIVVLATTRPELFDTRPSPFASVDVERIDLRGLGARDVATIAQSVAGHALPDGLLRSIAERTGGNPLFVEQIAAELGDDVADATNPSALPLPLTVEAAVQSRLDHLPPSEKELCRRASVLARPFTSEEIAALGIARADELLASLAHRDLVVARPRARGARGREHAFRSTLVSDVAYRMLADGLREELHRRAAAHLSTVQGASFEERASHHAQGGETSLAAECWASASLDAMRRGDGAAVLRCADQALAMGVPESARFALRIAKADALRFFGRRAEQAVELEAAVGCAADDASLARALAERTTLLWRTGKLAAAVDEGARAVDAARRSGDDDVMALACGRHGAALLYAGELDAAETSLRDAATHAAGGAPSARATVADLVAQLAGARGDPGAAREGFRQALQGFSEAGDLRRAANAEANLADAENRIGRYALAAAALRAAIEKCRRVGNRLGEGYALANLGYASWHLDRHDEALESLRGALAIADATNDARLRVVARVYFARAAIARGASLATVRDAEAVAESSMSDHQAFAALALAAASRGHLVLKDKERALSCSERALALRDALGSIEEDEAEIFLAHADALDAAGRFEEARHTLARGQLRLLEVAARIHDPERRRGFLEDVVAHRVLLG